MTGAQKTVMLTLGSIVDNNGYAVNDSELLTGEVTPLELSLLSAIQDYLITEYDRRQIVIEASPSSNIYIGRFDDYHKHPVFRWFPVDRDKLQPGAEYNRYGLRNGPIRVCVNTDDAGLFPTTIENEHRLLKEAAISHHGVCHEVAEAWVDRLRDIGVDAFTRNHQSWRLDD